MVGAGVALEHWRGLGELLARRKYAQLSAAQRSAAQRSAAQRSVAHATDTTKTPDDAQPNKTMQCQEPLRRRGSLGRRVISPVYALYGTHSASTAATLAALGGDNREVFGRAPVAASVVALLTTARLGRRSKGKARLARRCVAVAQRRRRAGQPAMSIELVRAHVERLRRCAHEREMCRSSIIAVIVGA